MLVGAQPRLPSRVCATQRPMQCCRRGLPTQQTGSRRKRPQHGFSSGISTVASLQQSRRGAVFPRYTGRQHAELWQCISWQLYKASCAPTSSGHLTVLHTHMASTPTRSAPASELRSMPFRHCFPAILRGTAGTPGRAADAGGCRNGNAGWHCIASVARMAALRANSGEAAGTAAVRCCGHH